MPKKNYTENSNSIFFNFPEALSAAEPVDVVLETLIERLLQNTALDPTLVS